MPPKPRWMAYRSAKWFQCAMEDARIGWFRCEMVCGFCKMAIVCEQCVFGPNKYGCTQGSGETMSPTATVASVWGEFA